MPWRLWSSGGAFRRNARPCVDELTFTGTPVPERGTPLLMEPVRDGPRARSGA